MAGQLLTQGGPRWRPCDLVSSSGAAWLCWSLKVTSLCRPSLIILQLLQTADVRQSFGFWLLMSQSVQWENKNELPVSLHFFSFNRILEEPFVSLGSFSCRLTHFLVGFSSQMDTLEILCHHRCFPKDQVLSAWSWDFLQEHDSCLLTLHALCDVCSPAHSCLANQKVEQTWSSLPPTKS